MTQTHTQHTPGPWKVTEDRPADTLVVQSLTTPYLTVAVMMGATSSAEEEANARLIAAAPDLLEVVELAAIDVAGGTPAARAEHYGILRRTARAAIAKARGETA